MGKDSIIPISKRTLVTFVLVLAMVAALVPTVAIAATEGSVIGQFTTLNQSSAITSIQALRASDNQPVTSLTPLSSYRIKITATDNNTVDDVDQVRVVLRFDAGDTDNATDPGEAGDTQTLICLKWVKATDNWSISPDSGTTWVLNSGNSTKPSDMGATTGDWQFYVTVGKVATEAVGGPSADGWDLWGETYDGTAYVEALGDTDLAMEWYGEISVNGNPDFGNVTLGQIEKQSTAVTTNYVANGTYVAQIRSNTDTWTSGSNSVALVASNPGDGQFSLLADDDGTTTDAVQVSVGDQTIATAGITSESGDPNSSNYLWLTLGSSGVPSGTYQGTIYYQIANG